MDGQFTFGPYEFDARRRRLTKFGVRLKLQPKAAAVLEALLQRPGETITRDELKRCLWPEGTYVDFELGIKVAVKKLRDALSDSADEPIYIQTVHGEGYRFIGTVEVMADDSGPRETATFEPAPVVVPKPSLHRRPWILVPAALLVGVVIFLAARSSPHMRFTSNDWVLVSTFENRSGNPALDGVLEPALERELNNSRFVHVVPRERVHDDLALMRRDASLPLTEDVARELCIRDGGIKVLVSGRVEKLSSNYLLTVNVVDPRSGAVLRSATRPARAENDLPGAVHALGNDLRAALGEEVAQIGQSNQQFERVTTPSLQALKLFTAGYELLLAQEPAAAASFFQQAVDADPDFATAWVYLGWSRFNIRAAEAPAGRTAAATTLPAFRRALDLAGRVSERERLFILHSWYYVNGDFDKALQYGETLVRLYPDHYWGANNTAQLLAAANRDQDAIAMERLCLRLRPQVSRALMLAGALRTRDPAAAAEYVRLAHQLAQRGGDPVGKFALDIEDAFAAWRRGDVRAASAFLQAAQPSSPSEYGVKAMAFATLGQLHQAETVAGGGSQAAPVALYTAFLRGGVAGVRQFDREHPDFVPLATETSFLYLLGANPAQRSQPMARAAHGSGALFVNWKAAAEGELRVQQHDDAAGLRQLSSALRQNHDAPLAFAPLAYALLCDTLATAYERTGDPKSAVAVFDVYKDRIDDDDVDLRWRALWPLLQRHKADLYRQLGDKSSAEAIEKRLSILLSTADPDYSLDAQRGYGGRGSAGKLTSTR